MILAPRKRISFLLLAGYFLIWLLPRIPAIASNTLHFDDFHFFLIINYPMETIYQAETCSIPPPDYRWIAFRIFCVLNQFFPGWPTSVIPKIIAGVFLAFFASLFFNLLFKWSVPFIPALLMPLVFIWNPIINEITLWNTTFVFPLWIAFCFAGFLLIDEMNSLLQRIFGISLLLIVVLAYEIYFTTFLILLLAEPVIKNLTNRKISWLSTSKKFGVFVAISGFYVFQVLMTKWMFGEASGRGFINITSFSAFFSEKIHGVFNLIVNCYMPVLSYYTGIMIAWSGWKWIPIAVASMTFIIAIFTHKSLSKSLILGVFSLTLPIVPTLPVFIMSQSPESWRVSILVLLAACFSLIPIIIMLWSIGENPNEKEKRYYLATLIMSRGIALAVLLGIFTIEVPVTFAEAKLRVVENNMDTLMVEKIKNYWETKGIIKDQFRVGVITNLGLQKSNYPDYDSAKNITQAYHSRGLASALNFDYSWRGFLMYSGVHIVELGDPSTLNSSQNILKWCKARPEMCRLDLRVWFATQCVSNPDYEQSETGWRLVHDFKNKITVICR